MPPQRASDSDRAHFRRIAEANAPLPDDVPPASLEEMFDRLDRIRRQLGAAARPGRTGEDDGDLESHLRYLAKRQEAGARGAKRA